jgi:glycosyltransferase involved in cell wall biosynthesis
MTPLVSVCMPAYNHAEFIEPAIESFFAQTLEDCELVIADDGSDDGTFEIAERYAAANPGRISVVTHPGHANRGSAATLNLCMDHGRTPYVAGLGSDDLLCPDALERGVDYLERHPRAGMVYGYARLIDATGRRVPDIRAFGKDVTRGGRTLERLVQGNAIPGMTLTIRRGSRPCRMP